MGKAPGIAGGSNSKSRLRTALIVGPKNVLSNWFAEFKKWLPAEPLSSGGLKQDLLVGVLDGQCQTNWQQRLKLLEDWQKVSDAEGGGVGRVLIVGYDMLRLMVSAAGHTLCFYHAFALTHGTCESQSH
jgi:SNF2 family DNA or RNA helicase